MIYGFMNYVGCVDYARIAAGEDVTGLLSDYLRSE